MPRDTPLTTKVSHRCPIQWAVEMPKTCRLPKYSSRMQLSITCSRPSAVSCGRGPRTSVPAGEHRATDPRNLPGRVRARRAPAICRYVLVRRVGTALTLTRLHHRALAAGSGIALVRAARCSRRLEVELVRHQQL